MRTYKEFADSLSVEERMRANALFESVYVPGSLICASFRESDAEHFKPVPLTEVELRYLGVDLENA